MKKLSLRAVQPSQKREDRELAEVNAIAGEDGRSRRRLGKTKQFVFRMAPARHTQLIRLADALETSMADVLEMGIDLVDRELKERGRDRP
jgi:hypothetical protein